MKKADSPERGKYWNILGDFAHASCFGLDRYRKSRIYSDIVGKSVHILKKKTI